MTEKTATGINASIIRTFSISSEKSVNFSTDITKEGNSKNLIKPRTRCALKYCPIELK
jgi:hypothetical protein